MRKLTLTHSLTHHSLTHSLTQHVVGNLEEVERLTDARTGTALVDPLNADGTSPLLSAAMMGHTSVVDLLLEQGANPELAGLNGANALHVAASMGHVPVIRTLIKHGANVNARHKFAGSTA